MNVEEILDRLDEQTVEEIMAELGSPVCSRGTGADGGRYMTFKTICHDGDSSKLYFYTNTKTFYCYTNCGAMSIFELISRVQRVDFKQALYYVGHKVGLSGGEYRRGFATSRDTHNEIAEMQKRLEALEAQYTHPPEITQFYNDNILRYFDTSTFYTGWIQEGITVPIMQQFGISYYWPMNHIIIPHKNLEGKLVGIRRRSLNTEYGEAKYMPEYISGVSYEHALGLNFYGLYENAKTIQRTRAAIIAEGEKSVLLSNSYFGDKSITLATCGFNITNWQINMLQQLGVQRVYLAFDKDYDLAHEERYKRAGDNIYSGYQHYMKRINSLCGKLSNKFCTYKIQDYNEMLKIKDSPFDRGKDVFYTLYKQAIRVD